MKAQTLCKPQKHFTNPFLALKSSVYKIIKYSISDAQLNYECYKNVAYFFAADYDSKQTFALLNF